MTIKSQKSNKSLKKQKNIKRTNSIAEVIKESQLFLQVSKKGNNIQVQKVTKKIQKQDVPSKKSSPQKQQNPPKKVQVKKKQQQKQKVQQQNQNQLQQVQQNQNQKQLDQNQNQQYQQSQNQNQQQQQLQDQNQQKQQNLQQQDQNQLQQQQNQNQQQQQRRREFTEEEIEKYIHREELQEGVHEMDQDRNFKERFLGREGAFSEFKILIGCFYDYEYNGGFDAIAGQELKRRGFNYEIERDFDKFVSKIMNYDIVWLISNQNKRTSEQQNNIITELGKFFKAKKSLYLWCENSPFHEEADIILKKYFNGMHMKGDYLGKEIITKGKLGKGTFDESHSIGYGLNNLYEGNTICSPQNTHQDFKHFAYNSNNEPLVSYAEENENHGRIIIDCGFTKLLKSYWDKAGTAQYVSNSNVWLTGIPQ